jgi:hypothetical protein
MIISIKKLIVLSLLTALAGGITVSVRADDKPADKPAEKPTDKPADKAAANTTKKPFQPTQQKLNGKVVAVDKISKSITIQINGQTYVLQLNDSTKIVQGTKQKSIYDVTVGEDISVDVMLRESPSGRVEVVVQNVNLPETSTEAAQGAGHGRGPQRPFPGLPDPAHIDSPIISPHRNR